VDSSTFWALVLGDPQTQPMYPAMGYDPASMIAVYAATGDEWDDTLADCERHILPLLREHGVRLVQVARGGSFESDGIVVLDDSRSPTRLHKAGPWRLSDELRTMGTVPMVAQGRSGQIGLTCGASRRRDVGPRQITPASAQVNGARSARPRPSAPDPAKLDQALVERVRSSSREA
jgi:hypothetical protein